MKVLFFGTPALAVPYLNWLCERHDVVGVVCRVDKPVGRGYELTPPPTKVYALSKSLPVFQPTGPWTAETVGTLADLHADVGVAVAYGRIMPSAVLAAPRLGCLNIHFSLLPKYRGAAPVQWALINGETTTGVTAFWLEPELDSGPIFVQKSLEIAPEDDAPTLFEKLEPLGIDALAECFSHLEKGEVLKTPQRGSATLAPILTKDVGRVDWNKPAASIVNLVRGVRDWPGATTALVGGSGRRTLKIVRAGLAPEAGAAAPGKILAASERGIDVGTTQGALRIIELQPEGKRPMSAWAFYQGARLKSGDHFE